MKIKSSLLTVLLMLTSLLMHARTDSDAKKQVTDPLAQATENALSSEEKLSSVLAKKKKSKKKAAPQAAPQPIQQPIELSTPQEAAVVRVPNFDQSLFPLTALSEKTPESKEHNQTRFISSVKGFCNDRDAIFAMSQNGSYLIEYLRASHALNLDVESLYVAMRIFHNKMKACEIIDVPVINHLLTQIPDYVGSYFDPELDKKRLFERVERELNRVMTYHFSHYYEIFKDKREDFLAQLSQELTKTSHHKMRNEEENSTAHYTERLRQVIIRMVDNSLSRAMWSPSAFESIWPSFLSTADNIYCLARKGILNHMDDVDDLCWSLVYRFGFFLELYGSTLPLAFYEEVESQITNGEVFFLEVGEQDEDITSKKEYLLNTIMGSKAKAIAFDKGGLFTDHQPF